MHGVSADDEIVYWRERADAALAEIERLRGLLGEALRLAMEGGHLTADRASAAAELISRIAKAGGVEP